MPAIVVAFFTWVFNSWFGRMLLQYVIGRAVEFGKKMKRDYDLAKKAKADAAEAVKKLKDAKSKEEIDAATDDALSKF